MTATGRPEAGATRMPRAGRPASNDPNHLRLELLRMRAAIEREELAGALGEVRERTVALRRLTALANRLGMAMGSGSGHGGAGGWLAQAAALLDQRPWVPLVVAAAVRLTRHRPWAVVVAIGALLLAARLRSAAHDGDGAPPPPARE